MLGYTWLALFFASGPLLAILRPQSPLAIFARFGFLREMGGISYCVYIIHTTVFVFCNRILLHSLPEVTDGSVASVSFLAALITYAIAKMSWKCLEEPSVRRGHGYRY